MSEREANMWLDHEMTKRVRSAIVRAGFLAGIVVCLSIQTCTGMLAPEHSADWKGWEIWAFRLVLILACAWIGAVAGAASTIFKHPNLGVCELLDERDQKIARHISNPREREEHIRDDF